MKASLIKDLEMFSKLQDPLRPVYTGDSCRGNSMQFLWRECCNFKIARVNQVTFAIFSAICRRDIEGVSHI